MSTFVLAEEFQKIHFHLTMLSKFLLGNRHSPSPPPSPALLAIQSTPSNNDMLHAPPLTMPSASSSLFPPLPLPPLSSPLLPSSPPPSKKRPAARQRRREKAKIARGNSQGPPCRQKKVDTSTYFSVTTVPQSPRDCKTRAKNNFKRLSTKEKIGAITSLGRKRSYPLFSALLRSKEFAEYATDKNLLLLRGTNLSDDDLSDLMPLFRLHPNKVISRLIQPENSVFVDHLLSTIARGGQEKIDKGFLDLYRVVNVGSKNWNAEVKDILQRLLPLSHINSSYRIGKQQEKEVEERVIKEMGLRWKLVYHSGCDDGGVRSVPYIVSWFSPKVFFKWLMSHSVVREVLNLPKNILLGTENIDAYAQFRFSNVGNEYVQYQFNPVSNAYLPRSGFLLIPLARARCRDSHGLVSSLFGHVITEMRCLEREGFAVGETKYGKLQKKNQF